MDYEDMSRMNKREYVILWAGIVLGALSTGIGVLLGKCW